MGRTACDEPAGRLRTAYFRKVAPDGHPRAEDPEPEAGAEDDQRQVAGRGEPSCSGSTSKKPTMKLADRIGAEREQPTRVISAPSSPTSAPSKMNGQRMNASEAPTSRMISISSARATTASRIVLTMMNSTIDADQGEHDEPAGPQQVRDRHDPVDERLDLLHPLDRRVGPEELDDVAEDLGVLELDLDRAGQRVRVEELREVLAALLAEALLEPAEGLAAS